MRDGLTNGRVWVLGLVYFVLLAAGFGLTFFVPDLVQDRTGFSDFEVGVLSAIPYGFATVAMILAARRGTGLTVPILVGAAGCALTAYAQSTLLLTVAITVAAVGLLSALPRFWAYPTAILSGSAAAAGIALVAAVGNLGGFVGPAFTGVAEDSTGGFEMPLTVLAAALVASLALVPLIRRPPAATGPPEVPPPAEAAQPLPR